MEEGASQRRCSWRRNSWKTGLERLQVLEVWWCTRAGSMQDGLLLTSADGMWGCTHLGSGLVHGPAGK